MESSIKRIKRDIEEIARITATPGKGCTRFSYSQEDKKARDYLFNEMKKLGLSIKIDGIGNIRAKYPGQKENPSIMIGSHIDTVMNGGKFDGLTGVITALEVIRVIKEKEIKIKNPIEFIIFAEEEGSNFGITMIGSKALIGDVKLNDLKRIKNDENLSAYEVAKNFGLNVDNIEDETLKKEDIKAMIELHVEQGGILDSENIPLGIVEAIVGMKTYKITFKGISNHAGSTPMNLRNDPMVGASEVISYIQKAAKTKAFPTTVATVGKILCEPNATNVIPEKVEFYVDIRDVKPEGIDMVFKEIKAKIEEISKSYKLESDVTLLGESDCVKLSSKVIDTIESVAVEKGYNYKKMNSGAVHDAAMLSEKVDVGMIFVPSINGKSHCLEELTTFEDIKLGCDLLLNTVIKLCNE